MAKLKKMLPWLILVLLLFYVVRNPHGAATAGHHLASDLASGAGAVAVFVTSLLAGK